MSLDDDHFNDGVIADGVCSVGLSTFDVDQFDLPVLGAEKEEFWVEVGGNE